jgi:hypothetical protein
VAALIVLAVGAFTAGSTSAIAANMAGPNSAIATRIAAVREQPSTQLTAAQAEQLRKAFAITMLASVVGLLAGAVAAGAGGYWGRDMADEMGVPAGRRV